MNYYFVLPFCWYSLRHFFLAFVLLVNVIWLFETGCLNTFMPQATIPLLHHLPFSRNTPYTLDSTNSTWDTELYSSSMLALYRARPCTTVVLTPANSTRHRPPNTYSISDCIHSLELQRIGVLQCSSVPVSPVRLRESQMVYFDVTFLIFVMSPMKRLQ